MDCPISQVQYFDSSWSVFWTTGYDSDEAQPGPPRTGTSEVCDGDEDVQGPRFSRILDEDQNGAGDGEDVDLLRMPEHLNMH